MLVYIIQCHHRFCFTLVINLGQIETQPKIPEQFIPYILIVLCPAEERYVPYNTFIREHLIQLVKREPGSVVGDLLRSIERVTAIMLDILVGQFHDFRRKRIGHIPHITVPPDKRTIRTKCHRFISVKWNKSVLIRFLLRIINYKIVLLVITIG